VLSVQIVNGSKRHSGGLPARRTSRKGKLAQHGITQPFPPKACSKSGDPEAKHPGGRPTKRTSEITARIAEATSFGLTDEEAAAIVGIDDLTLTRWRKIPEFCRAIKSAVAARKLTRLKRIDAGGPGWQGTAWSLERQYPERFARPEIQLNLGRASTDSQKRENTLLWLNRELPSIERIVQSQPEERNGKFTTGTDLRILPPDEDLDLSFDLD
jgi:hypothetical protein